MKVHYQYYQKYNNMKVTGKVIVQRKIERMSSAYKFWKNIYSYAHLLSI